MTRVKSWKVGSPGEPTFASSFKILKKAVLQNTDIRTNRNKYYAIELHKGLGSDGGSHGFRVFTIHVKDWNLQHPCDVSRIGAGSTF